VIRPIDRAIERIEEEMKADFKGHRVFIYTGICHAYKIIKEEAEKQATEMRKSFGNHADIVRDNLIYDSDAEKEEAKAEESPCEICVMALDTIDKSIQKQNRGRSGRREYNTQLVSKLLEIKKIIEADNE